MKYRQSRKGRALRDQLRKALNLSPEDPLTRRFWSSAPAADSRHSHKLRRQRLNTMTLTLPPSASAGGGSIPYRELSEETREEPWQPQTLQSAVLSFNGGKPSYPTYSCSPH